MYIEGLKKERPTQEQAIAILMTAENCGRNITLEEKEKLYKLIEEL